VSAARKVFQIVAIEAGAESSVIYCRLDNGELWRYLDRFDSTRSRNEWVRIPDPPGCKAWTGSNFSGPNSGEY
jgi:hypothetical protein